MADGTAPIVGDEFDVARRAGGNVHRVHRPLRRRGNRSAFGARQLEGVDQDPRPWKRDRFPEARLVARRDDAHLSRRYAAPLWGDAAAHLGAASPGGLIGGA